MRGAEGADGAVAIVQAIEKPAVAALDHIRGVAAGTGHARSAIDVQQIQRAVVVNLKAGDRAAAGVGGIDKAPIVGGEQPAGSGLFGRH